MLAWVSSTSEKLAYTHSGRTQGKGKETFFDAHSAEVTHKVVAPEEQQAPNESGRLWSGVTAAIKAKDLDAATEAKTTIEDAQRDATREREEKGLQWESRFFELRGGEWRPKIRCVFPSRERALWRAELR